MKKRARKWWKLDQRFKRAQRQFFIWWHGWHKRITLPDSDDQNFDIWSIEYDKFMKRKGVE